MLLWHYYWLEAQFSHVHIRDSVNLELFETNYKYLNDDEFYPCQKAFPSVIQLTCMIKIVTRKQFEYFNISCATPHFERFVKSDCRTAPVMTCSPFTPPLTLHSKFSMTRPCTRTVIIPAGKNNSGRDPGPYHHPQKPCQVFVAWQRVQNFRVFRIELGENNSAYYVYDFNGIVSDVGGDLGLFLGVSFFSFLNLIDFVMKKISK